MNILTPDGYKPIEEIQVGDDVLAFDMVTGEKIINQVLDKCLMIDEPEQNYSMCKFYLINNRWKLAGDLSIWRNDNKVFHIFELVVGDIIYDENDEDVVITSIEEVDPDLSWWKFHISGDHSYIVDGLTLHNANRFWVGGTGTWSSADTTKWSATSGGSSGSSVPGSADKAFLDGSSGGGTVTLNYALTIGGIDGSAHTGTFDTGNQTITFSSGTRLDYSGTSTRTLTLGSSTINCVGQSGGGWNIATTTGLTFNCGTSTIANAIGANASFQGGGLTYYDVTTTSIGGGAGTISGSNTFRNLTISAVTNTGRFVLTSGTTQTVTGTFTCNGTSSSVFGMITVIGTGTLQYAGITATINAANVSMSNMVCVGLIGTGAGSWTGTNLGDGGSCTGITFTSPVTRYWVGGTGTVASTANWSTSSGGAGGASVPLPQDTIVFDANSVTTSGRVITMNHCAFPTLDFSNLLNSPTITWTSTNGGIYLFGDLTMGSNVTSNGINGLNFYGTGTQNVNLQGHTLGTSNTIQLQILGTNVVLTGNWTGSTQASLISGTFDLNNYDFTTGTFVNTTQNITRALKQGTGQITLTGNNATIWSFSTVTGYTFTKGTKPIICNYSGSTGTRTIAQGSFGGTFGKTSYPDFAVTAGSDIISCSVSRIGSIDFTGFSGTLNNETRVIFGDYTLSSSMTLNAGTLVTTFGAETGDTQTLTTNGKTIDFPITIGVQATGAGTVQLGDNLTLTAARTLTVGNGTFTTNNKDLTTGLFSFSGANTRSVLLTSSTVTLTGVGTIWNCSTSGGLTFNAGTSTLVISDTSASSKTLSIGANALTYNNITIASGSAGQTIFSQVGTMVIGVLSASGANNIQFKSATSYTISNFNVVGTAGNLVAFTASTPGSTYTMTTASPQVVVYYASIQDSTASPAGTFYAVTSTNAGGNTNWNFINPRSRNTATRLKATTTRLRVTTDRSDATSRQHTSITL